PSLKLFELFWLLLHVFQHRHHPKFQNGYYVKIRKFNIITTNRPIDIMGTRSRRLSQAYTTKNEPRPTFEVLRIMILYAQQFCSECLHDSSLHLWLQYIKSSKTTRI